MQANGSPRAASNSFDLNVSLSSASTPGVSLPGVSRHHASKARGRLLILLLVALTLLALPGLIPTPDREGPTAIARTERLQDTTVAVSVSRRLGPRLPRSFLGISTEYWTLPLYARHLAAVERALSLLRVGGDGPLLLRIGGDSADHVLWRARGRELPDWSFALSRRWLRELSALLRSQPLRLILDLNLLTGSAQQGASWARAAIHSLPRKRIIGFEVGNEPDIYSQAIWLAALARAAGRGRLPSQITPLAYTRDFAAYARALLRVVPHAALLGPGIAEPGLDWSWIGALIRSRPRALRMITAHRYPLSACVPPEDPAYPTIARVLSDQASLGVVSSLRRGMALARSARLPFRVTELNSVTCGGRAGVSNTFATALWAPDALFGLLRAGVSGVNIHVREYAINAAFTVTNRGLWAHPLLYGLVLFKRSLGPGARVQRVRVQRPRELAVHAWAVHLRGGGERVVLINKGARGARVALTLPGHGSRAVVQRLLAPRVGASRGVTLAGQRLGSDGRWRGRRSLGFASRHGGRYWVGLPAYSAALVSTR